MLILSWKKKAKRFRVKVDAVDTLKVTESEGGATFWNPDRVYDSGSDREFTVEFGTKDIPDLKMVLKKLERKKAK